MLVYTARHVLPVAGPPVHDGAVAVKEGRIVAVGERKNVLRSAGEHVDVHDLADAALIPGVVNAHTHLELSWAAQNPPSGGDYTAWLRGLVLARERVAEETSRAEAEKSIAFLESRGTVAVGDVANAKWVAALLARSSLHGIAFYEIYGFRSADAERLLDEAAEDLDTIGSDPQVQAARGRLRVVLTPHAAHTTSGRLLKALAGRATASGEPLSIHVAESESEVALLRDGSGPFAGFLRERGAWDASWKPPGHSPTEYLARLGVLSANTVAVHCVHLGHQDVSQLQARRAKVVVCPRSNARLGVGKAPVPRVLASGVPVALGTDSLASAPDLDLFAEMAALRDDHPGLPPAAVLRMATLNGALALGIAERLGTLEPGKRAALVAVPLDSPEDDPLETVTSGPEIVTPLLR